MSKHRSVVALSTALVLALASVAHAAVAVALSPTGKVTHAGDAVTQVTVTCERGHTVLEAHLSISQDDQQIYGMAGIRGVRCTGRAHRYRVTVDALDAAYHRGDAYASAYVLTEDSAGLTQSSGASGTIVLH